jgi:hypothetical protein
MFAERSFALEIHDFSAFLAITPFAYPIVMACTAEVIVMCFSHADFHWNVSLHPAKLKMQAKGPSEFDWPGFSAWDFSMMRTRGIA